MLLPIFDILLNNEINPKFYVLINFLGIESLKTDYLLIIIIGIAIVYFLKMGLSILIVYYNQVIIENLKISIQKKVIQNYFSRSLISHNEDSIAIQMRIITGESNSALYVISTVLSFFIETLLLFFIGIFLFINFFKITVGTTIIFLSLFIIYYLGFNKKIKETGINRIIEENKFYQKIYSSLSIFREIKFLKKENFFINKILKIIFDLKKITLQDTLINGLIRPFTEFFLIIIILSALLYSKYYLNLPNGEIIASIGVFLAALIRCFPSITKLFLNYQKITFRMKSVEIVNSHLDEISKFEQEKKDNTSYEFNLNKKINIKNIFFSYKGREQLLNNINFEIHRNDYIGILGKNGSGKSTLLDLLTGLTKPNTGSILVDDHNINKDVENWQNKIIFLSQKNYLFEEDIISNIVLGEDIKNINKKRLDQALEISNFAKTIKDFPEGLHTEIGGNNFKLSGGQQKKIQIARCFYQITDEKKLIILDEPTDNLDYESRLVFYKNLKKYKNNKTIILISHISEDLKICDKIFDLDKNILKII